MPDRVVVTTALLRPTDTRARGILEAAGCEVVFNQSLPTWSPGRVAEALAGARGVVASTEPYTEEVFAALPELRVVARSGVGFDAVDLEAATRHGVAVCLTPGANNRSVADFAVTLILALARNLPEGDRIVRESRWTRPPAIEMKDKIVGIVGTGVIGKHVARRVHGFECRILAYDVIQDEELARRYDLRYVPLETLLRESDFVTLHAPLMPSTRHMIGAAQLRSMKPTAYLVNTARGPLVDEQALVAALQAGHLAGAGLDVFEVEPLQPDSPLRGMRNVILAPHAAGITEEATLEMARMSAENVAAILTGRSPLHCLNPAVLGRP